MRSLHELRAASSFPREAELVVGAMLFRGGLLAAAIRVPADVVLLGKGSRM